MRTAIVWFRNNLRLHDNAVLVEALSKNDNVLPVYIFDIRQWRYNSLNIPKTGAFRTKFLLESVDALRRSLKAAGANLLIRVGMPEHIIPALALKYKAQKVYAPREPGVEEAGVEHRLEKNLWEHKIELRTTFSNFLIHPDDLPFPLHALPDVFTRFKKEIEYNLSVHLPQPKPSSFTTVAVDDWGQLPQAQELNTSLPDLDTLQLRFAGGEAAAWQRLNYYFWEKDLLKTYKETRNGLLGNDYSSKFSPYLSIGAISPVAIYHEVKRYEQERVANDSTYWLIFELLWRDYFRYIALKYKSALFKNEGLTGKSKIGRRNFSRFWKWANGETGVPFIDANMKELQQTGFMSNRGRQNVACYLAKVLGVDWTMGAEYFETMLLDYDVSSNWGNWTYVAGVGNDPRENRFFNPLRQALMYDPKAEYQKHYLPELRSWPVEDIEYANELQKSAT